MRLDLVIIFYSGLGWFGIYLPISFELCVKIREISHFLATFKQRKFTASYLAKRTFALIRLSWKRGKFWLYSSVQINESKV